MVEFGTAGPIAGAFVSMCYCRGLIMWCGRILSGGLVVIDLPCRSGEQICYVAAYWNDLRTVRIASGRYRCYQYFVC